MDTGKISSIIKDILDRLLVPAGDIAVSSGDMGEADSSTWFKVEVKEPHLFLSRDAEGLFALNHLVKKMLEDKGSEQAESKGPEIIIDINGYQKKRIENLRAVAHMMAERARYFKSNIDVEPMSAYERRVVHEFLANAADLKTESEGIGAKRHVVIKYIGEL